MARHPVTPITRVSSLTAPTVLSLFVDFANAMFEPFSIFAIGGCHPIAYFVFSVRKALAMLPVFAILLPLVSALFRRRLANSRYSRYRNLNVGLPWRSLSV